MNKDQGMDVFEKAPVGRAVLQNVLPAMAAMLMVLVYNLADTFFIGQTRDALQVAAVSLATPVFLLFMAVGSVFGMGGTSVISRAMGEGRREYAQKVCSFCMWSCVGVGLVMAALFLLCMDQILALALGLSAVLTGLCYVFVRPIVRPFSPTRRHLTMACPLPASCSAPAFCSACSMCWSMPCRPAARLRSP